MTIYDVIKKPVVSEKGHGIKERENGYLFWVDRRADKPLIKRAIETLFNVKVAKVNTSVLRGKNKRFGKGQGQTSVVKKAVVSLKEGQIQIFDGV